jgi:hypothetical protein
LALVTLRQAYPVQCRAPNSDGCDMEATDAHQAHVYKGFVRRQKNATALLMKINPLKKKRICFI